MPKSCWRPLVVLAGAAQLLRPRLMRHLPFTCGALTKKRLPNDRFMSLIEPLRHNPKVRRDLDKYLRSVPGKISRHARPFPLAALFVSQPQAAAKMLRPPRRIASWNARGAGVIGE